MKRILLAVLIIAVVAAIAVGGTVAYFQTAANTTSGLVQAATISLTAAGNGGSGYVFFGQNMIPGDYAYGSITITNNSSTKLTLSDATVTFDGDQALRDDFVYTVDNAANQGENGLAEGDAQSMLAQLVNGQVLDVGQSITITFNAFFKETHVNQIGLAGKTASAQFTVAGTASH